MSRILVVEDESAIAELISINLRHAGFEVTLAASATSAQYEVDRVLPDLVVLDWMLPGQSGVALARQWRSAARTKELPIIMLTARADEGDKIAGLDAGADDYITKPFGVNELLARTRASVRRMRVGQAPADALFRFGDVELDLSARVVKKRGVEVHLTPIEYRLLAVLVANAGRVLTHPYLLREVWGPSHAQSTHYLRVYMGNLRGKLEDDSARPRYIVTETGVGYRLLTD